METIRAATGTRAVATTVTLGVVLLAVSTALAAALEAWVGVDDASPVYLLAVVVLAGRAGTVPAVAASVLSFIAYDYFFTEPRYTFTVADPQEWLSLLLFLVVAIVIGRLIALQAARAAEADRRAGSAHALFSISRALATAPTVADGAREVVDRLRGEAEMNRVWIGLGETVTLERTFADSNPGEPRPDPPLPWVLHRTPGDEPAEWILTHTGPTSRRRGTPTSEAPVAFRVAIERSGRPLGSLWALRPRVAGLPDREATRSLSLAADQLGLALLRERLAAEATSAEIARRSDALKSALVDSVSHDLRTPLATIRAVAGGLLDEEVETTPEEVRRAAAAIDDQAARLSQTVGGLLDLSRIEAGQLRAELEVHELGVLVDDLVQRERAVLAGRRMEVRLPPGLPPVLVDSLYFDQAVGNVLENAATHAGVEAHIRIGATWIAGDDAVELTVDDDGPGIPDADLERAFDRFSRGLGRAPGTARGMGIGLTVARGLTEAMGGRISAFRSELGGLAVRFRLPVAGPDIPPIPIREDRR